MIAGIVLAAGRSRRMGVPKSSLTFRGETFLAQAVETLAAGGCGQVVIVTGDPEDPPYRATAMDARSMAMYYDHLLSAEHRAGSTPTPVVVRAAVNAVGDSEQVDSLRVGLRALPGEATAALVLPVDMPTASAHVAREVIAAHHRTHAPIVLPTAGGRHGHPVLFAREVWRELLLGELPEGARSVIRAHADDLVEVPVHRLPRDVDTPEDYQRLLEEER